MTYAKKILDLAAENRGFVTARRVTEENIPRRVLTEMVERRLLIKTARGIYMLPDTWEDEWFVLQQQFTKGIYSHETALYLHGYSDRTPAAFVMSFPRGYHRVKNNALITERYAIEKIYKSGVVTLDSPAGNPIFVYDLEKTLCDIVRGNELCDVQIVNAAMKRYANDSSRNIYKLMEYAKLLRVEQRVKRYMEVLL